MGNAIDSYSQGNYKLLPLHLSTHKKIRLVLVLQQMIRVISILSNQIILKKL